MSLKIPTQLKYTSEHEWVEIVGDVATIGITDFAQSSLGDIVFVELPDEGTKLAKDAPFGVVESIKSVSDLYVPLSGEVIEKNNEVIDSPETINKNPYSSWFIKIKISSTSEIDSLLSADNYKKQCEDNA